MQNIEQTHKLSVLHCVFQLIASAEGNIDEDRDYQSIKLVLDTLNLNSIYYWDTALKLNPHDCFYHIAELDELNKNEFKKLMLKIAEMEGNIKLRVVCAKHIFQLCNIK